MTAWIIFLASASVVYVSSRTLASSGTTIARLTGFSAGLVGLVLLALATSLPEVVTGLAAIVAEDSVDLAAGNLFGSNVFNLAVIAVMDLIVVRTVLLASVGRGLLVLTLLSGLVIVLAGLFV